MTPPSLTTGRAPFDSEHDSWYWVRGNGRQAPCAAFESRTEADTYGAATFSLGYVVREVRAVLVPR